MCCCGKPTINGEPGYSWDGKSFGVRQPLAPDLAEGEEIIHDEPGRCGGMDSHCHHFRLVKHEHGSCALLVRHGGGQERIPLGSYLPGLKVLAALDSNGRYWLLQLLYSVQRDQSTKTGERVSREWSKAAVEKRIKTRKQRGAVKVWIEPAVVGV